MFFAVARILICPPPTFLYSYDSHRGHFPLLLVAFLPSVLAGWALHILFCWRWAGGRGRGMKPNLKTKKYSWPSIIFHLRGCMHIRKLKTKRKLQNAVLFLFYFSFPGGKFRVQCFFSQLPFSILIRKCSSIFINMDSCTKVQRDTEAILWREVWIPPCGQMLPEPAQDKLRLEMKMLFCVWRGGPLPGSISNSVL